MASQPSGVSTTPPSLVSSANLLRVHSNSSSRSLMKRKTREHPLLGISVFSHLTFLFLHPLLKSLHGFTGWEGVQACSKGVWGLGCRSVAERVVCRDWLLLQGAELAKALLRAKHLPPFLACWRSKILWEVKPIKLKG